MTEYPQNSEFIIRNDKGEQSIAINFDLSKHSEKNEMPKESKVNMLAFFFFFRKRELLVDLILYSTQSYIFTWKQNFTRISSDALHVYLPCIYHFFWQSLVESFVHVTWCMDFLRNSTCEALLEFFSRQSSDYVPTTLYERCTIWYVDTKAH